MPLCQQNRRTRVNDASLVCIDPQSASGDRYSHLVPAGLESPQVLLVLEGLLLCYSRKHHTVTGMNVKMCKTGSDCCAISKFNSEFNLIQTLFCPVREICQGLQNKHIIKHLNQHFLNVFLEFSKCRFDNDK